MVTSNSLYSALHVPVWHYPGTNRSIWCTNVKCNVNEMNLLYETFDRWFVVELFIIGDNCYRGSLFIIHSLRDLRGYRTLLTNELQLKRIQISLFLWTCPIHSKENSATLFYRIQFHPSHDKSTWLVQRYVMVNNKLLFVIWKFRYCTFLMSGILAVWAAWNSNILNFFKPTKNFHTQKI